MLWAIKKMNCWICGKEGTTREHLVKASDLKSLFGAVTQNDPLYFHNDNKKNIPVGSLKSKRLKSKALICNNCNSSVTQPYDRAWGELSGFLNKNIKKIKQNGKANLSKIFPGSVKNSMLHVHLYFLKLLGGIITENNVPIPITDFSESILHGFAHEHIYIAFGENPAKSQINHAGYTPIQSVNQGNLSVFASWMYIVDNIGVKVIYADKYKDSDVMKNTWHPSTVTKQLKLKSFKQK